MAKKLTPCACSNFEAQFAPNTGNAEFDNNPDNVTILTTGCTRSTHNTFAQGHDAKLVSFLVAWQLGGGTIHSGRRSGVLTSHADAQAAGYRISDALGTKAARAVETARDRADRAANRALARVAKQQAKADSPRKQKANAPEAAILDTAPLAKLAEDLTPLVEQLEQVVESMPAASETTKIKVGRWFYDAMIDAEGNATYTNGAGSEITIPAGKYAV